jgi:PAS domain-containing protein
VSRLLIVFIALLSLAIVAFVTEYFTTRHLLADATITHKRLEMAMASGRAVGWEWDLASGRNYWFGDLQTIFGIQGDDWSGHVDEFFRHVHPEDRQRLRRR